jgi:hypothetical protein
MKSHFLFKSHENYNDYQFTVLGLNHPAIYFHSVGMEEGTAIALGLCSFSYEHWISPMQNVC